MKKYKELKVVNIPKWGPYLREQWKESFAAHLSIEEQESIHLDHFLWHLCSWEKVECLDKQEAIDAFHSQKKDKCTIFYQFIDEAFLIERAKTLNMEQLPYEQLHMNHGDIYVMDWNKKWTFMMTHESECGPYFIKLKS